MKKNLQLILFLLIAKLGLSQQISFVKSFGGTSTDVAVKIITDNVGNIYTIGYFSGTLDFDSSSAIFNLTSNGSSSDFFILKTDSNGNFIWAKRVGGTNNDYARSITLNNNGHLYITGTFRGTVDFNPNSGISNFTSTGLEDVFISKFDTDGNLIWNKQIGGINPDFATDLKATQVVNDELIVVGRFQKTVDFDPSTALLNLTANGLIDGFDIFILKLSNSGDLIWCKQIGGESSESISSIVIDDTYLYSTGKFNGTVDFDPSASVTNLTAGFDGNSYICKLDISSGHYIWAKSIGNGGGGFGNTIAIDGDGSVYSSGYFTGFGIDFNPDSGIFNLNSQGGADIFISKLSSAGGFVWAKSIGGLGFDSTSSISFNLTDNSLYLTGGFNEYNVDFDPNVGVNILTASAGVINNNFILKLSNLGNFNWAGKFDGGATSSSIFVDSNSNIFTTGTFGGTVDFDINSGINNLTSAGESDFYIHKINQLNLANNDFSKPHNISLFPNPTNSSLNITTQENIISINIINLLGKKANISNFENNKIDVSNLQNGIYFIEIATENGLQTQKFIKN